MFRTLLLVMLFATLIGCNKGPATTPLSSVSATGAARPAGDSTTGKKLELGTELQPRATFKPKHRLPAGFPRLTLAPDGARLAVPFSDNKKSEVWDIVAEPKQVKELDGEVLAISPDGALVVRLLDSEHDVANVETGATVYKFPRTLRPHRFAFRSPTIVWHLQGSENRDRWLVKELNTGTRQETDLCEIVEDTSSSAGELDIAGRTEWIRGFLKTYRVQGWDITTGRVTRDVTLSVKNPPGSWGEFDVSLDGKWISAEFIVGQGVQVFDGSTGALVSTLPKLVIGGRFVPKRDLFVGKWSPGEILNGRWQGTEGHGFFDTRTGKVRAFAPSDGLLRAISADGRVMVTARKGGDLKVWDLSAIPSP